MSYPKCPKCGTDADILKGNDKDTYFCFGDGTMVKARWKDYDREEVKNAKDNTVRR